MRSVPAGSFERLSSLPALWRAYEATRRGKRRHPAMARFDLAADTSLCLLREALESGRYRPGRFDVLVVCEPRRRLVAAPPIIDRVVHHALIAEIGPTFERGFIDHSYACGTGRGPARAVLRHLGWMRTHRHRLSLDIRLYFPSVRQDLLLALIERRLRDARTLGLVRQCLEAGGAVYQHPLAATVLVEPVRAGCGLAIGTWFSQWSSALYLDGLDHYVKRTLKVGAYLRYGDDLALFHDDAGRLRGARDAIEAWLAAHRGLSLNPRRTAVEPTGRPCTFLGYRVSRAGLRLAPKAWRRMRARLREAEARGPEALARSVVAYEGLLRL